MECRRLAAKTSFLPAVGIETEFRNSLIRLNLTPDT